MLHVISYDISDTKRRRRLAANMEAFGRRVQESVFETYATTGNIRRIIEENSDYISPSEGDSLRVYRICANCAEYFRQVGGVCIDWKSDIVL